MNNTTSQSSTSAEPSSPRCFACQKVKGGKSFAQCSRCRYAVYCNPNCQKVHWAEHKALCNFIKKSSSYFLNLEPRMRNEFIQRRVAIFNTFPSDCSEEEKLNLEMISIRQQLVKDLKHLHDGNLCFLGYTMLMEAICINMGTCDASKALAFCNTPHALHLFFLFSQQLIILISTNTPRVCLPAKIIKRELLSMWRVVNQMMENEEVCMKMLADWNETLPDEIDEVLIAPLLLEHNTTMKSLLFYFMTEVEPIGADLEGLVWQVFAFADIFTSKNKVMEDEIKNMKNDIVRRKNIQGQHMLLTVKLFDFAKSFAVDALRLKGIYIR